MGGSRQATNARFGMQRQPGMPSGAALSTTHPLTRWATCTCPLPTLSPYKRSKRSTPLPRRTARCHGLPPQLHFHAAPIRRFARSGRPDLVAAERRAGVSRSNRPRAGSERPLSGEASFAPGWLAIRKVTGGAARCDSMAGCFSVGLPNFDALVRAERQASINSDARDFAQPMTRVRDDTCTHRFDGGNGHRGKQ